MAAIDLTALTVATLGSVSQLMDWDETFQNLRLAGATRTWAFRGQPAEYQSLKPSYPRSLSGGSAPAAELMENDLIHEFRRHYAALPDRSRFMPEPDAIGTGADVKCLSVMQHYEVPTRLLDWTGDFWTAVYFACASEPGRNAELWSYDRSIFEPQRRTTPALNTFMEGSAEGPEPVFLWNRQTRLLVEFDKKVSPRMSRQVAHHTVASNVFDDHSNLLDDLAREANQNQPDTWYFRRLVIDKGCKGNALEYLKRHKNITASTIFPDVVGLGRFLRWHFDSLKTMLQ